MEVLSGQQGIGVDNNNENVKMEKRIMWTPEEDERLMSAWLKNSTDSSIKADRNNEHYWGDVVKSYNMTTRHVGKEIQSKPMIDGTRLIGGLTCMNVHI